MRRLSLLEARRLAILANQLGGARPSSLLEVVERLTRVQVDPTSAVERAERLTLFSRLGPYERDDLRRLLEEPPRQVFEYRAFLVSISDLPLQRPAMLRYPRNDYGRGNYVGQWLADNTRFRAYVLDELRSRGPLLTRDLDDRAEVPWQTSGWNDGKNLGRMLEILWNAGEIAISRREGTQRVWDLWEHVLPQADELPDEVVAVELLDRQLRARGFDRTGWGGALEAGELPFRDEAEESLRADGVAVPVEIDGLPGEWLAHTDGLTELDAGAWQPRTTLLGPFDPLVADRDRALKLFDFRPKL
ncbi:MAG TPA: crosslink repair DNA glycosylase YcaQ family protein, partial [Candidatus Limnocylindria bacterium]|nr:crosslink repair DNA glycosylase YcaQ family protein [Candidatus Limnocylindria bacterium]